MDIVCIKSSQNRYFVGQRLFELPELLSPWYVLEGFSLSHEEPLTEELFSRDILERVGKGFDFLLPYYRYFSALRAEGD